MKIIDCTDADYAQTLQSLYTRPACPPEIEERAKAIVEEVRLHGDKAVLAQIAKFDGVKLTASKLKVSDAEIKAAKAAVPKKTRDAVKHAIANIRKFSSMQIPKNCCRSRGRASRWANSSRQWNASAATSRAGPLRWSPAPFTPSLSRRPPACARSSRPPRPARTAP